jgi:toxin ParE1/3/4
MGRMTDQPGVRVLPVVRYPYLIFYTVVDESDEVRILRIRHGRRRPLAPGRI